MKCRELPEIYKEFLRDSLRELERERIFSERARKRKAFSPRQHERKRLFSGNQSCSNCLRTNRIRAYKVLRFSNLVCMNSKSSTNSNSCNISNYSNNSNSNFSNICDSSKNTNYCKYNNSSNNSNFCKYSIFFTISVAFTATRVV